MLSGYTSTYLGIGYNQTAACVIWEEAGVWIVFALQGGHYVGAIRTARLEYSNGRRLKVFWPTHTDDRR